MNAFAPLSRFALRALALAGAVLALGVAAAAALAPVSVLAAPTIHSAQVVNVTPSSFEVLLQTTEEAEPDIAVFTAPSAAAEITSAVAIERFPVELGARHLRDAFEARAVRRQLQDGLRESGVLLIRVSGLDPQTNYHVRVRATGASGTAIYPGDGYIGVRTARRTGFVGESRQVRVNFAAQPGAGRVALLTAPGAAYPLAAVVGDGAAAEEALFNLSDVVATATNETLQPSGPFSFGLTLLRASLGRLEGANASAPFVGDGRFLVAAAISTTFTLGADPVTTFTFDPIAAQRLGEPFLIAITARTGSGAIATSFTGTVALTSSGTIASGGGTTPAFVGGKLMGHGITIASTGLTTLQATSALLGATGTSAAFDVAAVWSEWASHYFTPEELADPAISGPYGDPTNSGVPNLMRYAFGLPARLPITHNLTPTSVVTEGGKDYLAVTFQRQQHAPDILYTVEGSNDLATWTVLAVYGDGAPSQITVRDTVEFGSTRARYLRVRIVRREDFTAWSEAQFTEAQRADAAISGPLADPTASGVPNLLRYAFDLSPTAPAVAGGLTPTEVVAHEGKQYLAIRFQRARHAPDLRYIVEASTDLASWTHLATYSAGEPRDIFVRDTAALGTTRSRYLRVRVEQIAP